MLGWNRCLRYQVATAVLREARGVTALSAVPSLWQSAEPTAALSPATIQ